MNTTFLKGAGLGALALAGALAMGGSGAANAVTVGAAKASTAQGQVAFDCLLVPFNSAFRYEGAATVGSPASGAGSEITAQFPELPALAPVPIDGGKMRVWAKGTASGNVIELKGSSVVNAAANETVPMPEMKASVAELGEDAEVKLNSFGFEFDQMMGLEISAQCDAVSTAKAGTFALDTKPTKQAEAKGEEPAASVGEAAEENDDTLVKVAMWGLPVALVVAAVLVWLPRRRGAGS